MARDEELLEEIRETFKSDTDEWRAIRREGSLDMRYLAGDPWDPKERKDREDAGRPCLSADELSQYDNQVVNDLKQNKRAVTVTAKGNGATEATARFRQGKIRDIEYASNAQQAYTTMAENCIGRSYGFLRIKAQYCSDEGHEQELVIEPVVNPDMVTVDPFALRPDGADMRRLFNHESLSKAEFKREYGGAKITDFTLDAHQLAGDWLKGDRVQVAEYWVKQPGAKRTKFLLKPTAAREGQPPHQPREVHSDDVGFVQPTDESILKSRVIDSWSVKQYVTNGLEILKRADWPGKSIPFVTCYGKVLYIDRGEGIKREILSLVRLARDPQMLYAYYRTQQAEMAGMIPKVPVMAVVGQFRGLEDDWQKAPHVPLAFLEYNAKTEATGEVILPPPQRLAYEAGTHLQALEMCAEGARRAIMAAIGSSPLPSQAQRHNEKSGIALKQIADTAQLGSYHFVDHYNEAITRTGQILDELIPFYYDTARTTSIRKPDDSPKMVRINDPQATDEGQPAHIDTSLGDHDVTISVGPAMASEREAASGFADTIIGNHQIVESIGPQKTAQLIAAAIRLKNVGPIGDEMAEIIDPKATGQQDPKQLAQQMGQMHQQLQVAGQKLQEASQIIATKQVESASREKIVDAQIASKERMFQAELDDRKADRELKLATAEEAAKVTRLDLFLEERARLGLASAAVTAQQSDQAHDVGIAAMGHVQGLEAGQQQAAIASDAADQGQAHALESGQQAADLAPQPTDDEGGA